MSGNIRLHATLRGRVQGVGFRYFVREQADRLRVAGWVRNLRDGRVELIAEGRREALEQLAAAARQGPQGAQVDEASLEWSEASGEFSGFAIIATA